MGSCVRMCTVCLWERKENVCAPLGRVCVHGQGMCGCAYMNPWQWQLGLCALGKLLNFEVELGTERTQVPSSCVSQWSLPDWEKGLVVNLAGKKTKQGLCPCPRPSTLSGHLSQEATLWAVP